MNKSILRLRKQWYYLTNALGLAIPRSFYQSRLERSLSLLDGIDVERLRRRVEYYNKLQAPFRVSPDARQLSDFRISEGSTYFFDLRNVLKYFPYSARVDWCFGDITHVPHTPSLVKSRPITDSNENSILMPFNQIRHFVFVRDRIPFRQKEDRAVWRGKGMRNPTRRDFVERYMNQPCCDVGLTDRRLQSAPSYRPFMSIPEQLRYKFIVSIEGNDVATNLKWIMSSQALCLMTRPRYETWFMEGMLAPDIHYVLLKDDYSDLEQKISYYRNNPVAAERIIENANDFVHTFQNPRLERLAALMVLDKYLRLSGQRTPTA